MSLGDYRDEMYRIPPPYSNKNAYKLFTFSEYDLRVIEIYVVYCADTYKLASEIMNKGFTFYIT